MAIRSDNLAYQCHTGPDGTDRGPTRAIWRNCPWFELQNNPFKGFHYVDDFTTSGVVAAAGTAWVPATSRALGTTGNWSVGTAATSGAITTTATDKQGVINLTATDDNQDVIMAWPPTAENAGPFDFTAGNRIWMEARIKTSTITNDEMGFFIGFAEQGLLNTTELISAAGALADKDYVGFFRAEGDGDLIKTLWNTASGSASPNTTFGSIVPVADTWLKLGLYFDGTRVYFFADGKAVDYSVPVATADFPDGEEMAFYIGIMTATADTESLSVDWVRLAQENKDT